MFFHLTTSSLCEGDYWNIHLRCGSITTAYVNFGKLDTLYGSTCFSDYTIVFCKLTLKEIITGYVTIHRYSFEYHLFWLQVWLEVQGSELVLNLNWFWTWTEPTEPVLLGSVQVQVQVWAEGALNWTELNFNSVTVQRDPYPFPWSRDTKHVTTLQPGTVS